MKLSKERMQEIREFVANGNYAATEGCIVALEMMLAEALDTIERYEKSLEYVSKMAELDEQTRHMKAAETYYWATIDMMGKAAREALNPKEGA